MERVGNADAPLGQKWVQPIAQLYLDGEWDESDIVKSHERREGAKDVWAKILGGAASRMDKPEPSVIAHVKALRSILTLSPLYSAEVANDLFLTPSRVKLNVEQPYVPVSSSTLRDQGKPRTTDPASLSVEEVEDMAAQGAISTRPGSLGEHGTRNWNRKT